MTTTDDAPQTAERFSRADYARLPEDFRAYLLDGALVRDPAPTWGHQALVLAVARRLSDAAPGRLLTAPADVVVDDWNVLQPDVLVLHEADGPAATAAPESVPALVVEVLSAATRRRDRTVKTAHYLRAGVAEVWLLDPAARTIEIVTCEDSQVHDANDTAESAALRGFRLTWSDLSDGVS